MNNTKSQNNATAPQNQVKAGTSGRKRGHAFEMQLASDINGLPMPFSHNGIKLGIINIGEPHKILLLKILELIGWNTVDKVTAYATGPLATAQGGAKAVTVAGHPISSSKSDLIVELQLGADTKVIGVSVKQCSKKSPTNAQLFFTTATAFYNLLNSHNIPLSTSALDALKQFCGDKGFTPLDSMNCTNRVSTPHRYFWEETNIAGRLELENVFSSHQDEITKLLLERGYPNDPFPPEIIFHKTKAAQSPATQEVAVMSMNEFLAYSKAYGGFSCDKYRVKKGRYKEPADIEHLAPRFGVIQMQRGGQKQHPTQLQFNLKSGYFYHLIKP